MTPSSSTVKRPGISDGLRVDRAVRLVWNAAPRWTVASFCLLAIQSVVPLGTLYLFKLIVDSLTGPAGTNAAAEIPILILLALALALLGNLCGALLGHVSTIQAHLVADNMQRVVQTKSIDMDLAYYENPQYFDKLHRAQREAPTRPIRIVDGLTQVARNSLTLLGALAMLLLFHWGVVAALLAASIPVVYFRLQHAERLYELDRQKTLSDRTGRYLNQLITTSDHAKEVRVFDFGPMIIERFAAIREKIRTALQTISASAYRRQFATESAAALAGFGSLAFIAESTLNGSTSLGELVMYFGAFQVAIGALRPTLGGLAELYENNLFLSSLFEFLDVRRSVPDPENPTPIPTPWRLGIKIEGIGFRYPGTDQVVLDGVDMAIGPGEIVALVGRNGSGKTSLTKLLCRLYDPDDGRITVEGVDLRDCSIAELRNQISVIYQDYGRYHLTARENICIGSPNMDPHDPAVEDAAKWAGIHDEIVRLPDGYDTVLSRTLANGAELSIGQWQKLALARAYVRKSQLIVLDEPTSSLDAAAEFAFFEKFRMMADGRSALIISHRFSTVRLVDRVFVLDGGKIIESGTHGELLDLNGLYAHLYNRQASYYDGSLRPKRADEPQELRRAAATPQSTTVTS
ncbi:MAG: ABC transporter ATP-binding protein [Sterolibacteriaceae bacterium]|nr:ABC transporter ATP-binding protein [Sterolibacteriaceae bacterium]